MAETIEYKPELGGVEGYRALAKKRFEDAQLDFERIMSKDNLDQKVIDAAKLRLNEHKATYEAFVNGLPKDTEDSNMQKPKNNLH